VNEAHIDALTAEHKRYSAEGLTSRVEQVEMELARYGVEPPKARKAKKGDD